MIELAGSVARHHPSALAACFLLGITLEVLFAKFVIPRLIRRFKPMNSAQKHLQMVMKATGAKWNPAGYGYYPVHLPYKDHEFIVHFGEISYAGYTTCWRLTRSSRTPWTTSEAPTA